MRDALEELMAGRREFVVVQQGRVKPETAWRPKALLPGSFNPLHYGHRRLAQVAGRWLSLPVSFELSALNVDKPPLSVAELERRARQFEERETLVLTRAPTFHEKGQLFPGTAFVVGCDTAERIAAPRYYADAAERFAKLTELQARGCTFLVAARVYCGRLQTLGDLSLPAGLTSLFAELPPGEFREDISSTELRSQENLNP